MGFVSVIFAATLLVVFDPSILFPYKKSKNDINSKEKEAPLFFVAFQSKHQEPLVVFNKQRFRWCHGHGQDRLSATRSKECPCRSQRGSPTSGGAVAKKKIKISWIAQT